MTVLGLFEGLVGLDLLEQNSLYCVYLTQEACVRNTFVLFLQSITSSPNV